MANDIHEEHDRRALELWEARDSPENRGERGRAAAARVLARFRREVLDVDGPVPPAARVYHWLGSVIQEPEWHAGRRNRALPQRAVFALLETLAYPHLDALHEFVLRRMSGVDLRAWWLRLRALPRTTPDADDDQPSPQSPPPPAEDARLLWRAYRAELEALGEGGAHKVLRQRWRRWNRWLRDQGIPGLDDRGVPWDPPAPPLPAAYTDPRYRSAVEPYVRLLAALRWSDHDAALGLFRTLGLFTRKLAERDPRRARTLRSYVRPFFHVCLALTDTARRIVPALDACSREDVLRALATLAGGAGPVRPDLGRCLKAVYQFTHGAWSALLPTWSGWAPLQRREVGYRPEKRRRARDRFTEEEVDKLRAAAATDPFDHGLLVFLLHTGCRSGASCSLLVTDVTNEGGGLRASGSVVEKGGVRREFDIDPVLAGALHGAILRNRGSPFVFPANRGIGRRPEGQNDAWLRALCRRCTPPIAGPHVHVHALRRTTISLLMDCGNRLECVSQWIGHHSTTMTQRYWEPGPRAAARNMVLPWARPDRPVEESSSDTDDEKLSVIEALLERTRTLEQRLLRVTQTPPSG